MSGSAKGKGHPPRGGDQGLSLRCVRFEMDIQGDMVSQESDRWL